jgi:ELWxxDGT repeat protein
VNNELDSLWKSDGTSRGTVLVKDKVDAREIAVVGSRVFFTDDVLGTIPSLSSLDLWVTDGTPTGTHTLLSHKSANLSALGNRLLFSVIDSYDGSTGENGLWKSDGTAGGTTKVLAYGEQGLGYISAFCTVGPIAYFYDGVRLLWRTDGTKAGTIALKDLSTPGVDSDGHPISFPAQIDEMFNFNGTLFFDAVTDSIDPTDLWRSDGTPRTTKPVGAINPGSLSAPTLADFTAVGNRLFFSMTNPSGGRDLWASDGNTVIRAVPASIGLGQGLVASLGSQIYFNNATRSRGSELWQFNPAEVPGNLAGTIFSDGDDDNVQASGESGARGRIVYLDTNNNAQLDAGELSATTTSTGRFQFNELPPGKYRVRVVPAAGQIAEAAPRLPVTSFATKTIHIGVVPSANIHGVVFNDANHNAIFDAGDTGIASARLYLDANSNHAFDPGERNVRTDSDGGFAFDDLLPGTYALRASAILSWTWTMPIARTTTLAVGGSVTRNFGGYLG